MQVCIVSAGKSRESSHLTELCKAMAKGIESQGHRVDVVSIYDGDTRLTIYDYVVIGSEPVSFFSAKVPELLSRFLEQAGTVSGKRCMAFVTGGLRKNRTLLNLMKKMESEGMILKFSEVIQKPDAAAAVGRHLNVERNI